MFRVMQSGRQSRLLSRTYFEYICLFCLCVSVRGGGGGIHMIRFKFNIVLCLVSTVRLSVGPVRGGGFCGT